MTNVFTLGGQGMASMNNSLPDLAHKPSNGRSDVDFQASILAAPVSALALISVQKIFDVGLGKVLGDVIDVWRHVTAPLSHLLAVIVPFHLPSWYPDLFVISFILATLFFRSLPVKVHMKTDLIINWLFSFAAALLAAGVLMLVISLHDALYSGKPEDRASARLHLRYVFHVICLTLVFYVANSSL